MQAYEGFEAKKDYGDGFGRLPAGNYVGKILSAKIEENSYGASLVLAIDITEGEYANFFKNQFDASTDENKKWKGTCRISIPQPGSEYFAWQKRNFENAIACIEESNKGFHWDWNESKLKGKTAGFRFRDKEFENAVGEVIEFTECLNLVTADDVRTGKAKLLKAKRLSDEVKAAKVESAPTTYEVVGDDDDDLPF